MRAILQTYKQPVLKGHSQGLGKRRGFSKPEADHHVVLEISAESRLVRRLPWWRKYAGFIIWIQNNSINSTLNPPTRPQGGGVVPSLYYHCVSKNPFTFLRFAIRKIPGAMLPDDKTWVCTSFRRLEPQLYSETVIVRRLQDELILFLSHNWRSACRSEPHYECKGSYRCLWQSGFLGRILSFQNLPCSQP